MRLIKEIKNRYQFEAEFTVELNPAQTTAELFKKLYDSGVNRISLGAQSFNQNELDFLGRAHTVADIENAVINARKAALHNLSIDLIFAIPGSRDDSFLRSLRSALYLGPQHISAYSLTYEQNTPLKSDVDAGKIKPVDEGTDRTQYTLAIDELAKAGFEQYEISNFARGGFECRHNLNCWENKPYIGLGPAAASWFQGKRYTNIPNVTEYIKSIKNGKRPACDIQKLTPEQIACETAVLNLRRTKGIDLNEFTERTGYNAIQLFSSSITKNLQLKLIRMISGRIELTKKALPIADSVLCDFASPD